MREYRKFTPTSMVAMWPVAVAFTSRASSWRCCECDLRSLASEVVCRVSLVYRPSRTAPSRKHALARRRLRGARAALISRVVGTTALEYVATRLVSARPEPFAIHGKRSSRHSPTTHTGL